MGLRDRSAPLREDNGMIGVDGRQMRGPGRRHGHGGGGGLAPRTKKNKLPHLGSSKYGHQHIQPPGGRSNLDIFGGGGGGDSGGDDVEVGHRRDARARQQPHQPLAQRPQLQPLSPRRPARDEDEPPPRHRGPPPPQDDNIFGRAPRRDSSSYRVGGSYGGANGNGSQNVGNFIGERSSIRLINPPGGSNWSLTWSGSTEQSQAPARKQHKQLDPLDRDQRGARHPHHGHDEGLRSESAGHVPTGGRGRRGRSQLPKLEHDRRDDDYQHEPTRHDRRRHASPDQRDQRQDRHRHHHSHDRNQWDRQPDPRDHRSQERDQRGHWDEQDQRHQRSHGRNQHGQRDQRDRRGQWDGEDDGYGGGGGGGGARSGQMSARQPGVPVLLTARAPPGDDYAAAEPVRSRDGPRDHETIMNLMRKQQQQQQPPRQPRDAAKSHRSTSSNGSTWRREQEGRVSAPRSIPGLENHYGGGGGRRSNNNDRQHHRR